jgi:prolyl-tRNA editing enzyme YbaK/EbsC (Cys-tRNA(Pro) deacylase)
MRLKVKDILEAKGTPYRIIELRERAISVNDVMRYSINDINPEEICKTILIKQKNLYYALFLRGKDKIDFKKLKGLIGKSSIASLEEVLTVTGVEPGAICPLLVDVPIILDKRVLCLEKLNFGSGNHLYGIEIASSDLECLIRYKLADIAE